MEQQQHEQPAEKSEPVILDADESETRRKRHDGDDWLSSLTWALILIWAGLVFLAANFNWLETVQSSFTLPGGITIAGLSNWSIIALGAGVLVFLAAIVRTFVPAYQRSQGGNFFGAAILLGVGLSGIVGWEKTWPLILIAMGFSALASALIQRKR